VASVRPNSGPRAAAASVRIRHEQGEHRPASSGIAGCGTSTLANTKGSRARRVRKRGILFGDTESIDRTRLAAQAATYSSAVIQLEALRKAVI
jgi:hypothetical protein